MLGENLSGANSINNSSWILSGGRMFSGLEKEMVKQSQNWEQGVFRCASCLNYKGACTCEKGIFIAFEGANLTHCSYYQQGKKCRHCGRMT
jgi:hypothetical protein